MSRARLRRRRRHRLAELLACRPGKSRSPTMAGAAEPPAGARRWRGTLVAVQSFRSGSHRIPLRAALLIDAPTPRVRAAAVAAQTWSRAAAAAGLSMDVAGRPASDELVPGGTIRFGARRAGRLGSSRAGRPGSSRAGRPAALFRVDAAAHDRGELVRLRGDGRYAGWSVTVTAAETLAGSLVTVDVRAAGHARATRVLRNAQLLLGVMLLAAHEDESTAPSTPGAPATAAGAADAAGVAGAASVAVAAPGSGDGRAIGVVVAGVVIRDGAVLAARRTYPPELAGYWECPGGKVEPGESETVALARELAEELGISVAVGDRIGPELDLGGALVLHAYQAALVSGDPSPSVHDAVRWVGIDELDTLAWLPSDTALLPALRHLLTRADGAPSRAPSPP